MSGTIFASSATNQIAFKTATYMNRYQAAVNQSIERISSGKKFNSAADNPGETGYINRFRAAIMSYKTLNDNMQNSVSMLQTADSAMTGTGGIASILESIREKAIASQGTSLTTQDRQNLQQEVEELIDELDEIAKTTEFNTKKLLNGEMGASLSSSDSGLYGYATDKIDSQSFHFTDIAGATKHLFDADNGPSVSADTTHANYDYTASLGSSGGITLDGTNADTTGDYELLFTSSSEFDVYNNSTGVLTASGSVNSEFTLNGMGITISSGGSFVTDYKYNFSTTNGSNTLTATDEGNRGLSANTTLTAGVWGSDSMLNSYFDIKFQFDSGSLKYAAYDSDGNRMGSFVESGEEFEAFESSKLNGSTFTFKSNDAGIGDIWRVEFGTYGSIESAGGTISIGNATASFTVSYTGEDRLSDIVSAINNAGSDVATAELVTSSSGSVMNIEATEYGDRYRLSMYDLSGDFISTLGLTEESGTGTDASLTYNGREYDSSNGYFNDLEDNLVIEVANGSEISSGYINVSDKSVNQVTNANGGTGGVEIFIRDVSARGLGLIRADGSYGIDLMTDSGSQSAISLVDSASDVVSEVSTNVGSLTNRFNNHSTFLDNMTLEYQQNLSLHEDVDFAEETSNYYLATAQRDAAAAMTAQANVMPQRVLQLLGIINNS